MKKGFTIVELLIVLAILGIIVALGIGSFLRGIRVAQLQEDQSRIAALVTQARNVSRRYSFNVTCTSAVTGLTCQALNSSGTVQTILNQTVTLVYAKLTNPSLSFTFQAPFGRLSEVASLTLQTSAFSADLDIIGVTGIIQQRPPTPL